MHWACRNIEEFSSAQLQGVYDTLSPSRKMHIARMRRQEDRRRSLAAELAAYELLGLQLGITDVKLQRQASGMPYFSGCDLFVSIAHSGQWVACAVSQNPVGIDIEGIRPIGKKLCNYVCLPEEKAYVLDGREEAEQYTDPEVLRRFFEIWTAKEAYFKKQGTGITDFKSVNVLKIPRQIHRFDGYILQIL